MCTNFTPTKNNLWVQDNFGGDLPQNYPSDVYPGFLAPILVKRHQSGRVACGAAHVLLSDAPFKEHELMNWTHMPKLRSITSPKIVKSSIAHSL